MPLQDRLRRLLEPHFPSAVKDELFCMDLVEVGKYGEKVMNLAGEPGMVEAVGVACKFTLVCHRAGGPFFSFHEDPRQIMAVFALGQPPEVLVSVRKPEPKVDRIRFVGGMDWFEKNALVRFQVDQLVFFVGKSRALVVLSTDDGFPSLLENGLFLLWREAVQKSVVRSASHLVTFPRAFPHLRAQGVVRSRRRALKAQQLEILLHDRLLVSKFHVRLNQEYMTARLT